MTAKSATEPQVIRGVLMVMSAVVAFSLVDFFSKYLTHFYPIGMVVWARYTFHVAFVFVALAPRHGLSLVRTRRPGVQLLRGFLLAFASLLFVCALKYMPLAESTAIAYLAPLIVTLMSVVFLKEKIELARWMAVLCGFIGVLTIIRPGSSVFQLGRLAADGQRLRFRDLSAPDATDRGHRQPLHFDFLRWPRRHRAAFAGAAFFLGHAAIGAAPRRPSSCSARSAALGHLILIKAYDHGPASRLAPFGYTQLIWVMAIGYVAFGDFPDHWSLIGIVILVASGIYTATHERVAAWLQRRARSKRTID